MEFDATMLIQTFDFRDYNRVCETASLNERKKEWENFTPSTEHPTAYGKWQKDFTHFMNNNIEPGSKREEALRIIMSDPKKRANEFAVEDADKLFTDFCKDGRSNINNFIKRVTTILGRENKRDSNNLKQLLPHLQWIASGLFGKETASQAVTRLIELDSAVRNDPRIAVNILDKERINTLTDDEEKVLGFLQKSFSVPQEKISPIPTQEIKPVTTPAVLSDVPQAAPVDTVAFFAPRKDQGEPPSPPPVKEIPASTSGERLQNMHKKELEATREKLLSPFSRKEQDRLGALMIDRTEDQISKMTPQEQERVKGDMEEMLRMDIANLETIIKEDGLGNAQGPTTQDVSLPLPTPAESDLAPAEPTPERISEIGRKEFSLTDRPFLRIPQEERDGIIINVIRAAGGKYGE